jgi:ubiquinol-cytochrome c reductase cytochrome c1 subunit
VPAGGFYNEYYPGHVIAMPPPLSDDRVDYAKGPDGKPVVPQTVDQYARDVTAFLAWAAEPHLEARKRMGFGVIAFLLLLTGLMYFTKKKVWADVGGEIEDRPGVKTV